MCHRRSHYRAANAIFGKVGRTASEEVTIQLIKSKCMPILLYGLVACQLSLVKISFSFCSKNHSVYFFSIHHVILLFAAIKSNPDNT